MKQFAFEYINQTQLTSNLDRVVSWITKHGYEKIWIRVYVTDESNECFQEISDTLDMCIPNAKYMLTHAGMGFASGSDSSAPALVVCNIFEDDSTNIEMFQYSFSPETFESTVDTIIAYVKENPWVKLISLNTGANLEGISYMNKLAKTIDPSIVISGGAAVTKSLTTPAKVSSSSGRISTTDLVVTYVGGENFEARTDVIVGWKGIGKEFTITKAEGAHVSEIDGMPAFDIYKKYLKIESEPGMIVESTIEFPLCFEDDGILFLRCPLLLNEDDTMIMMMNDLAEGKKVRLSFGSMDVILGELASKLDEIAEFEPQVLSVNSCFGRLVFWGDNIQSELGLFHKIAPSSGYLTGGEITRHNDRMLILNETIVNTAMREGPKSIDGSGVKKIGKISRSNSLAQRLSTFIETVTSDLEEYTKTVQRMAITDELTGLYNRRETDRIISELIKEKKQFSLIMVDADSFKHINDTYGHQEGDRVLQLLSRIIKDAENECGQEIYAGRWGGDEFLMVVVGDKDVAENFAKTIQQRYHSKDAYKEFPRTMSIGIAAIGVDADSDNIFQTVDEKLYEAKSKGKGNIVS